MPEGKHKPGLKELATSMTTGEIETVIGAMSEQEIRAWVKGLSDEELRMIHPNRYDPLYLNLLAIFYKKLSTTEIARIAAECTRSAIWNNRVLNRWMDALPDVVTVDKKPLRKLQGLDGQWIKSLAIQHHGLIICTFRLGQYNLLPFEIALNGVDVTWIAKNTVCAAINESRLALKARLASLPAKNDKDIESLENGCRMGVLPVIEESTSLKLLRALKTGKVVLVHADGNAGLNRKTPSSSRCDVQFMDFSISVKTGIANLAWTAKVPILPMIAVMDGMDSGRVCCGELIFRPHSGTAVDRDVFIRHTMQSLYDFLGEYGRARPEQWPGVASVHKWRREPAAGSPGVLATGEQANDQVKGELAEGRKYVLNEAGAIAALSRRDGWILVDMKSLKSFKPPQWVDGLLHQLCRGGGLSLGFIESHTKNWNVQQHLTTLRLLAEFKRNGLIKAV